MRSTPTKGLGLREASRSTSLQLRNVFEPLGHKKANDIVQVTEIIGLVTTVLGLRILDSICRAVAAAPSSRPPATPVQDISSTLESDRSG